MQPATTSIQRGQTALWTVTAWTEGGNVPDATIRLMAAPASLKPVFSFGCGSHNGGASCDLGALDAKSAQRQLQAKIAVATSATTVTSVRLTAVASAASLTKDPQASATTSVTAASAAASGAPSAAATNSAGPSAPGTTDVSPLTVGNLPYLPSASPVLSPGGNASGLFPTLTPSADPPAAKQNPQQAQAIANTSALPQEAPVVGAQLAGLGVLALAFLLAVARLSFRRRSASAQSGSASQGTPDEPPGEPPAHR